MGKKLPTFLSLLKMSPTHANHFKNDALEFDQQVSLYDNNEPVGILVTGKNGEPPPYAFKTQPVFEFDNWAATEIKVTGGIFDEKYIERSPVLELMRAKKNWSHLNYSFDSNQVLLTLLYSLL